MQVFLRNTFKTSVISVSSISKFMSKQNIISRTLFNLHTPQILYLTCGTSFSVFPLIDCSPIKSVLDCNIRLILCHNQTIFKIQNRLFSSQLGQGSDIEGRPVDAVVISQVTISMTTHIILHNQTENYFFIILKGEEKKLAKLEYVWIKPGLVDLYHTEVPAEYQGQGIAKQLVLAALNALCTEEVTIRPTCSYVQKVLRENQTQQYIGHIETGFKI
ncbi:protein NATD1 [Biomphalaria pfeifferi]|uniref:Protein NATD1 n=1 Tax=Biomphalaria pfeifferi TaxID=112525 RepID=A0AAD8AX83_BIOPF|nr:protein NATD1 [Biomphalaria pfeifferi]